MGSESCASVFSEAPCSRRDGTGKERRTWDLHPLISLTDMLTSAAKPHSRSGSREQHQATNKERRRAVLYYDTENSLVSFPFRALVPSRSPCVRVSLSGDHIMPWSLLWYGLKFRSLSGVRTGGCHLGTCTVLYCVAVTGILATTIQVTSAFTGRKDVATAAFGSGNRTQPTEFPLLGMCRFSCKLQISRVHHPMASREIKMEYWERMIQENLSQASMA